LEILLVRLATLPKSLPVTQLIDRLTQLESRLLVHGQPAAAGTKASAPGRTETSIDSLNCNEANAAEALGFPSSVNKDQLWQNFVSFISKEKKLLASHLEFGSALAVSPENLTIGIAEKHHLSYLQDAENMALLKSFANRFFSRDVTIELVQLGAATAKAQQTPSATGETGSEIVKEALRVFGGSIKGVRKENA
jgi:hypothetical protein